MKWVVYGLIAGFVAYNWDPIDLAWWQWYLLIGLCNYIFFCVEHKQYRYNDPGALVEWAFFVFAWPVQLAFFILVAVNSGSQWMLERIFR